MVRAKTPRTARKQESPQHPRRTIADRDAAIAVLRAFLEGDEEQQRETLEAIKRGLDEGRPDHLKLFPANGSASRDQEAASLPADLQRLVDKGMRLGNPQRAIALLDRFMQEDEEEQRETWAYLKKALDEDRPEGEKLFS